MAKAVEFRALMSSCCSHRTALILFVCGLPFSAISGPLCQFGAAQSTFARCTTVNQTIPTGLDIFNILNFSGLNPDTCNCVPSAENRDCDPKFDPCNFPTCDSRVLDVRASLSITHPRVGELVVALEHLGSASRVRLLDRPGSPIPTAAGCLNADVNAVFDDFSILAAEGVCDGNPGIGGRVAANEVSVPFRNQLAFDSQWQIAVGDAEAGNSGVLNEWCVEIDVAENGQVFPFYSSPLFPADGGFGCSFAPQDFFLNSTRDVDWVRYESAAGPGVTYGTHSVMLTVPSGSGVDPILALYDNRILTDPTTPPIAVTGSCIDGQTPPLSVSESKRAASFQVRVQNCDGGSVGTYTLQAEGVSVARFMGICLGVTQGPLNSALIRGNVSESSSGQTIPSSVVFTNTNNIVYATFGAWTLSASEGSVQVTAFSDAHQSQSIDLGFVTAGSTVENVDFVLIPQVFSAATPADEVLFLGGFE